MDKKVLFVIVLICFSGIVKAGRPAELDSLVIDKSMIYDFRCMTYGNDMIR